MSCGDSAQPEEHGLADPGYSLNDVGGDIMLGQQLEQRSEFARVSDHVTRLVDGYPSTPVRLHELAFHIRNFTTRRSLRVATVLPAPRSPEPLPETGPVENVDQAWR